MRSDTCTVDLEWLSNGLDCDSPANSTITLLRSLPRKGPTYSGGGAKMIFPLHPIDKDTPLMASRSIQTALSTERNDRHEKPASLPGVAMAENTENQQIYLQPQHQITIKTANISNAIDGNLSKKHGLRRSPRSRFPGPRRILLFFATLSSIGTMLLIFFTLKMSKTNQSSNFLE
ncbi:hypothetical protein Droror1_Dr00020682 [Drosera rotundifolia]